MDIVRVNHANGKTLEVEHHQALAGPQTGLASRVDSQTANLVLPHPHGIIWLWFRVQRRVTREWLQT